MVKKPADVTETELAILSQLWERGPSEIRELVAALYGDHTPARHATVKSLLDRLLDKGFVEQDRSRFAHRFQAKVDRETFVGQQLQKLADHHFAGSLVPMMLALVDKVRLSRQERDTIRQIIENID